MNANELWAEFRRQHPELPKEVESWSFGKENEELMHLVLSGKKVATCSGYDLYDLDKEELPSLTYNILCDSEGNAVCILHTDKVELRRFDEIGPAFAFKEGEGDLSLAYWQKVHREFFRQEYHRAGLEFSEDKILVCEEFRVVFKGQQ